MFLLLLAIAFIVYVNLPFFKALKKEEKFESVIANPIIITKTTVSVKPTVNSKPPVAANPTINSKPPVAIKPTVNSKPRVAVKPTVTVKTYVAAKYTVTSKPPITANSPAPVKPPVFTPFLRKRKLCVYTDESSLLEISPKICRQKISLDEQEKPPEPPTSDALFLLSILDELSSEIGLDDPMEIDFNGVLSTPLECALEEGK